MGEKNNESFKIKSLHIEEYKMFKDFDIDFVDKDDNPLPIIVLAGVNGSGKTTLLECLYSLTLFKNDYLEISKTRKAEEIELFDSDEEFRIETFKIIRGISGFKEKSHEYKKHIVYINTDNEEIENLKQTICQRYIDRAFEIDKPSEALKELQIFISKVFNGLDLTFNLSSIHYTKEIVLFKNNNGKEFDIDELSTGEKTLLSKVLYLFFQDYKNKVILIDEPELSLHPSWQNRVLKIYENFAKVNNCQVIIATHSPHIIGSAKSESLRILKRVDEKIEALKYSQSYGFEFDKILTNIMGVENLRTPDIAEDIKRLWELLKEQAHQSEEYQNLYRKLEKLLGDLDQDLLLARLEVAKLKSRNA